MLSYVVYKFSIELYSSLQIITLICICGVGILQNVKQNYGMPIWYIHSCILTSKEKEEEDFERQ
jgi:hypothetical protein